MLLHESILVLDPSTGKDLEAEGRSSHSGFQGFDPHSNKEDSDELNRSGDDKEEDAPHRPVSLDERVILACLVKESEVDDAYLHEKRRCFQDVQPVIVEWLMLCL